MRTLIVEDDFISRRLLQSILSAFGASDVAVNGLEALEAFKLAIEEGNAYDLVCLDIMMPEMDGHDVLRKLREYEESMGRFGKDSATVIMTTALGDLDNIKKAFEEQCEYYLIKPVDKNKLVGIVREAFPEAFPEDS